MRFCSRLAASWALPAGLAALTLIALAPKGAAAAETKASATASGFAPSRLSLHGDAYGGYARADHAGDGVALGLDALVRWRFLQAGALAESSSGRKETIAAYGVMAGLAYYKLPAVGFDLVGVFGVHVYDHIGDELASNGAHGNVGFLQGRAGVTFLPLKPFTFGAWLFYGDDLVRASRTYSAPSSAPGAAPITARATIGEPAYGAMLRIGFDLPL